MHSVNILTFLLLLLFYDISQMNGEIFVIINDFSTCILCQENNNYFDITTFKKNILVVFKH